MRRPLLAALLPMALALAVAGCGGGGEDSAGDQSQNAASVTLIRARDLPYGTTQAKSLPSGPCNPLEVLARDGSQTAESSMYEIEGVRVQEAVGVFEASAPADDAYDALNAQSRLACIRQTIELQGDLSVKVLPPRKLSAGGEGQAVSFEVVRRDTGQENPVEVASVKSGRSVASLIFIGAGEGQFHPLVDSVSETAAGLLAQGAK